MRKILAIDVGGTFIKCAVLEGVHDFKIAYKNKFAATRTNHDEFLQSLADTFKAHSDVEGIALSMPGLIDADAGICLASELFPFNNGRRVAHELAELCGVPVTVDNDANCAALAEVESGALADVNDAFVLVFGTSVGGTFIHNREICRGAHFCAGEVAFTLKSNVNVPSDENFYHSDISAAAFQKMCAEALNVPIDKISAEKIFKLINADDAAVSDVLRKYAHGVAVKIFNLQMLFDPERFALGGGISEQKIFIDTVNAELSALFENAPAYLPRPVVVACKYRNDANLFGALYRYLKR